jgi:hypothetical protein
VVAATLEPSVPPVVGDPWPSVGWSPSELASVVVEALAVVTSLLSRL